MSDKIDLGNWGEELVAKSACCPRCKKARTLKKLVQNFKCADLICDFCGFIAQVKAARVTDVDLMPKSILGAAWGPQKARMDAGIYTSLFVVLRAAGLCPTYLATMRKSSSIEARAVFFADREGMSSLEKGLRRTSAPSIS